MNEHWGTCVFLTYVFSLDICPGGRLLQTPTHNLPLLICPETILYTADRCSRNVNRIGPFCCFKLCSDFSEQHSKLKPPPFHGLQDFMRSDSRWPRQPHRLQLLPELMGCAANRPSWPLCCSHSGPRLFPPPGCCVSPCRSTLLPDFLSLCSFSSFRSQFQSHRFYRETFPNALRKLSLFSPASVRSFCFIPLQC